MEHARNCVCVCIHSRSHVPMRVLVCLGRRGVFLFMHAPYFIEVGQGSRRDSPTTRLGKSCWVSLGDGGDPYHRWVSPIWLVNAEIMQKCARNPSSSPKPLQIIQDVFTMWDEVVWDDEERADVMSLDMTNEVMSYQSFLGASIPANVSLNIERNGRRKGRRVIGGSRHFR